MKLYVIEQAQLEMLLRLSKRLHTEDRMNGDEMRDAGHQLEAIVHRCQELEIPEGETRS